MNTTMYIETISFYLVVIEWVKSRDQIIRLAHKMQSASHLVCDHRSESKINKNENWADKSLVCSIFKLIQGFSSEPPRCTDFCSDFRKNLKYDIKMHRFLWLHRQWNPSLTDSRIQTKSKHYFSRNWGTNFKRP